ncbi:MAG TPA: hypothetical protein VFH78_15595 [Candidatus Thermoplasmatota archaeon]|nr:hypothetical protein [Candidatus Thermoplasmatota archaeon]
MLFATGRFEELVTGAATLGAAIMFSLLLAMWWFWNPRTSGRPVWNFLALLVLSTVLGALAMYSMAMVVGAIPGYVMATRFAAWSGSAAQAVAKSPSAQHRPLLWLAGLLPLSLAGFFASLTWMRANPFEDSPLRWHAAYFPGGAFAFVLLGVLALFAALLVMWLVRRPLDAGHVLFGSVKASAFAVLASAYLGLAFGSIIELQFSRHVGVLTLLLVGVSISTALVRYTLWLYRGRGVRFVPAEARVPLHGVLVTGVCLSAILFYPTHEASLVSLSMFKMTMTLGFFGGVIVVVLRWIARRLRGKGADGTTSAA